MERNVNSIIPDTASDSLASVPLRGKGVVKDSNASSTTQNSVRIGHEKVDVLLLIAHSCTRRLRKSLRSVNRRM